MSMLTPPGMGRQYRITGDKYPRMRRPRGRRRLAFLAIASVAALGLIGWGTLQLIDVFTGGDKASAAGAKANCAKKASPSPTASAAAGTLPEPGQITVNVGDVGNATKAYDKKVEGTGLLLGAKAADAAALPVLNTQLPGAEVQTDGRQKATEVDLVIGTAFKALTDKEDATKALAVLARPVPTPSATKKSC
jgi:hypothetical protein